MKILASGLLAAVVLGLTPAAGLAAKGDSNVAWRKTQLDGVFHSEGVAVPVASGDGLPDMVTSNKKDVYYFQQK